MYTILVVLAVAGSLAVSSGVPVLGKTTRNESEKRTEQPLYYEVESLNKALPALDKPPDLSTPRAALVNFFLASRDGNFDRAARSLNFQTIPDKERVPVRVAMQLYYVMSQRLDVDFKKVPDRSDGVLEEATDESDSHSLAGQPRRSIKIGEIPLTLGDVEIRLERFKPHNEDPVWLFSPRPLEKIEDMYERHGPGPLFEHLPFRVRQGLLTGSSHWQWFVLLAVARWQPLAVGCAKSWHGRCQIGWRPTVCEMKPCGWRHPSGR